VQTECGGGFEKFHNSATAFCAVAHNCPSVVHVMTAYEVLMAVALFWH
jgi:hypothetical protein